MIRILGLPINNSFVAGSYGFVVEQQISFSVAGQVFSLALLASEHRPGSLRYPGIPDAFTRSARPRFMAAAL
jgi:hypothetical protein